MTCGGWPCRRHAIPDLLPIESVALFALHGWIVQSCQRRRPPGRSRRGLGDGCGGVRIALV